MDIQIDVLEWVPEVLAAFYYEIAPADQLPAAVDMQRDPAGTRLSQADILALRKGEIYEFIFTMTRPPQVPISAIQAQLVAARTAREGQAQAEYRKKYSTEENAYNGSSWV